MVFKYLVIISLTLWKYNNLLHFLIFKIYFACRYLDNMNINGTLDITNMQTIGQRLQVLSLTNNDITNVIYSKSLLAEGHVIV
jgi:hypothetical protein